MKLSTLKELAQEVAQQYTVTYMTKYRSLLDRCDPSVQNVIKHCFNKAIERGSTEEQAARYIFDRIDESNG